MNLKRTLSRNATAKSALYELLEAPTADKNAFLSQMAKPSDDEQTLTSLIGDTQNKLSALEAQRGDTAGMLDFVRNNKAWAKNIGEQIFNLSSANKQRLIEAMITDKIMVNLEVEENGVEHWGIDHKLTLNISCLQAIAEEGLLAKVNPR